MLLPWGSNAYGIGEWGTGLENITAFPTGIGASASLGNETTVAEVNEGWGRLTWGENGWGIQGDVLVSGVSGSVSLGDESISIDVLPVPTGINATASVGSLSIEIATEVFLENNPLPDISANLGIADAGPDAMLTGIGATGSVGSVEAYNLEGWGRYFWGQYEWGATGEWDIVPVTGISLSANLGSVSITANANTGVTGELMTAAEGTVDPSPDATVTGIGFSGSLAVGTVIIGEANVTVTGTGFGAGLGLGTLNAESFIDVTGIAMSASVGSITAKGFANVTLTGFALTSSLNNGNTLIWNQVNTGTAPTWTEVTTRAA
jgi:hypothetical protein